MGMARRDMTDSKTQRRRRAAEYWDTHGIDEAAGKTVQVEVENPLSSVLSVRVGAAHLGNLKALAETQGVGITTMAEKILAKALEEPANPQLVQSLSRRKVDKVSVEGED